MNVDNPLYHTKHIFRIGILLLLVLVVFLLGRSFFVPDSWGQYGNYRGDSVGEMREGVTRYTGSGSCQPCHEEIHETHAGAGHAVVACELCHGPLVDHVLDGEVIGAMPVHRHRLLCLRCHQKMPARPDAIVPQVEPRQHVQEQDGEFSEDVCFDCHDPHEPL